MIVVKVYIAMKNVLKANGLFDPKEVPLSIGLFQVTKLKTDIYHINNSLLLQKLDVFFQCEL